MPQEAFAWLAKVSTDGYYCKLRFLPTNITRGSVQWIDTSLSIRTSGIDKNKAYSWANGANVVSWNIEEGSHCGVPSF